MVSQALAATRAAGFKPDVAYVPRPSATPEQVAEAEETGTATPLYTANPAPMGLGYYGLSQTTDLYVAEEGSNSVDIISDATNTVTGSIPVGNDPSYLAYDPANGYVYVSDFGSNSISVINTATNTPIPPGIQVGGSPDGIAYDPVNGYVYVANYGPNSVTAINGLEVVGAVSVGENPTGVAVGASGYVYVTDYHGNTSGGGVTLIDGLSDEGEIAPATGPQGVAYDPADGDVYVANTGENSVTVISDAGHSVVGSPIPVGVGPYGVAYDSQNGEVYVTNSDSDTVSVIAGLAVVATVTVPAEPNLVTYDPQSGELYVTNSLSGTVTVISSSTNTVEPTITVGTGPAGVAVGGPVAGSLTPATLDTTGVQGYVSASDIQGADLVQAAPDSYSIQLNAVLTGVTLSDVPGYTFWTQDIATYFPSSDSLMLVSNVWDFSAPDTMMPAGSLFASGPDGDGPGGTNTYATLGYYFDAYPMITGVTYPFDLTLTMTSGLNQGPLGGGDQVSFNALLSSPTDSFETVNLEFDSVTFNSDNPTQLTAPALYQASGAGYDPADSTYDFELVICGPGGASNVDLSAADATFGLAYYQAGSGSFVSVPSAYSYGGDTGESSIGANVAWSDAPGGPAGLTDYGTMDTGPSILSGLWGTGAPEGTSPLTLNEDPANAFNFFIYYGTDSFSTPIISQYEYAPNFASNSFNLMPGNWGIRSELSGYSPYVTNFTLGPPGPPSPHPGALDVYEVAPGGVSTGGGSVDPSVCYATVCSEMLANVYETLVTYDGSSTSQFLPVLSTCVPGSGATSPSAVSCQSVYGQSLVVNNPSTGLPEYWTFPIDKNARFYDPGTGASWSVYPSDVMFSLARTMSYADLPGTAVYPGWIQSQALLSSGNSKWDSGIHAPYNNTPANILGSMLVNNSAYCPSAAMVGANGCITFVANGGGTSWPFFLQLVSAAWGAGIQSCGWAAYEGGGLPGFPGTSRADGDGPCLLPGGATTTGSSAFQNAVSGIGATGWDAYQLAADNYPAVVPNLQYAMVGSGPYYLASLAPSTTYSLEANPDYAPPNCQGVAACDPEPGTYVPTVNVNWESNDAAGISGYETGDADFATIGSTDTPTLLSLQADGKVGFVDSPSFSEFFLPFELNFNVAGENSIDPTGLLNVPSDFFSSDSVRNFLTHAWPYATVNATLNSIDGVSYGFNYGGPIPQFMGDFYPANVSFPSGDPITDPSVTGSAAWWWMQANEPSSPYYDSELSMCTPSTPCKFPIVGFEGAPTQDSEFALYISEIEILSGGALQAYALDVANPYADASQGIVPYYSAGWLPDYGDPTDYLQPLLLPNGGFYTYTDSVSEQLAMSQYNSPTCGDSEFSATDWSSLIYWANLGPIPSDCQGVAYSIAASYGSWADSQPLGSHRALAYNLVEHIFDQLALYTWEDQTNEVESYASWIDPATVNTNPIFGGDGIQLWFNIGEEHFLDIDLPADPSAGVYTPLWAFDNSEVAALAQSGQGTPAHPYVLINYQPAPLSASFGLYNDYGFPVFPGVFLLDTDTSVELSDPPSFNATTNDSQSAGDLLPQANDLQYWFWGVSNVALVNATNISGWFGAQQYSPLYFNSFNVIFYDSSNNLVANNSFFTQSQALLMYTMFSEPDDNTVWGNTFLQVDPPLGCPSQTTPCFGLLPYNYGLGLEVGEDYDLIYNNLFATPTTAWLLPLNLYTGAPELYPNNRWNIATQPASDVNYALSGTFPTFPLSGSIVGGTTQGGNSWWDYGVDPNVYNGANNPTTQPYDENAPTLLDPLAGFPTYAAALSSVTYSCDPTAPYTSVPLGEFYCGSYIYATTGGDSAPLATVAEAVEFAATGTAGSPWGAAIPCEAPPAKCTGSSCGPPGCAPPAKCTGSSCGPPGKCTGTSCGSPGFLLVDFLTTQASVYRILIEGSYSWFETTGPPGSAAVVQNGTVTVPPGASQPTVPVTVAVSFVPGYTETITESGLPSGSVWWFSVTGRLPVYGTVSPTDVTISDVLPKGTFSYLLSGPPGYAVVGLATGTITEPGAMGISVTFAPTSTQTSVAISPNAGPVGSAYTVTGSGFTANSAATVTFNSATQTPTGCPGLTFSRTTVTTSESGGFVCTFTVPSVSAGPYGVVGHDTATDGSTAAQTYTVTVPKITVSPSQGPIGATVTVTGSGFTASSGATVTGDGVAQSPTACSPGSVKGTTITTSPLGAFTCTFRVPSVLPLPYLVVGHDLATGKSTTSQIFLVTWPTIRESTTQGPKGALVTLSGTGFSVSTTLASLVFDSQTITTANCLLGTSLHIGTGGAFTCTFAVPGGTSGTTVKATDVGGQIALATFTVTTPKITLSPTSGAPGATLTVTGTGFSASTTLASLTFNGAKVSCTSGSLKTTASGTFSCTFKVPSGTPAATVAAAATDVGGQVATASFKVT